MSDHKTYRSRNTIRARRVEDENETVVTRRGPATARRGDYVLRHDSGDVHVIPPEEFETSWEEAPDDEAENEGKHSAD